MDIGTPCLVIVLAALGAVFGSVILTRGFAPLAPLAFWLLPACLAISAAAICIATDERGSGVRSHDRALSYQHALDEHFLVTKFDGDGRFLQANEKFLRRLGYGIDELAGQSLGRVAGQNLGDDEIAKMQSALRGGPTWSGEFCYRSKDGQQIWLETIVIPWRNTRGELECMSAIGVDVTKQRSAEAELMDTHTLLEVFVKHVPASVAMFDTGMRYVAHTDRWLQDYKLPPKSLVGRHHYEVFPEIPEHWRAKHLRILAGATETCAEERFLRADGTENFLRWEVRPWYLHDHTIGGIIMMTEEISERKKIENTLWQLAKLDALTGLPNRLLFNDSLRDAIESAIQSGDSLGVALIDLDHFKDVNDTLGHDAGDELLKVVAERLQNGLLGRGVIARLGGDEFAVVILDAGEGSEDMIMDAVREIERSLIDPVNLSGTLRSCSASIGVTIFPRDGVQPKDLLKNADLALYRAKTLGRGRISMFSPDLRTSIDRKVELLESAFAAIEGNQFLLHYQPIVPSSPEDPVSFEALLRWNHPVHGLLSPGAFEEVFDDRRVAAALGERVADMALAQAAAWQAEGLPFGRVAINVSTADFSFGCFARRLEKKLAAHKVAPEKICIEVTERVFLGSSAQHVSEALHALDALGVEIALDDFGTGYASLSHIKSYPIGRLKIDRSFVMDMQNNRGSMSVVHAIVQLGRSLGVRVTAEGVEHEEQLLLLKSMGCGSLQGYYFSRPLPADEISSFVNGLRRAA